MAKPLTIGDVSFKTKKAAADYVRAIVAKYENDQEIDADDMAFMLALFENHPLIEAKIGCGIKSIVIRQNPVYTSTRTFYLIRVDDSFTDCSWTESLTPTPHKKQVVRALRALVEPQIEAFKAHFFDNNDNPSCELTGENIAFVGSHVDHVPPLTFDKLVEDFCGEYELNLADIPLRDILDDNKYVDLLGDERTEELWREYHYRHATLRVISRTGNLSIVKRGIV